MKYDDLVEIAKTIVNNIPTGEFEDKTFSCSSGGVPVNRCGVKTLHEDCQFAYHTCGCGNAYKGEVTVRCRVCPGADEKGRPIYEDEDGTIFVFTYGRGDESSFDSGSLRTPILG